jgi:glycosyltransferase involved in cell wall biosynthesis
MRIVIDLQGAQTESRFRGIGRYSLSFVQAVVRNSGEHEVLLALNGLFPETVDSIRAAFDGLLPQKNIRVWFAPGPLAECEPRNRARTDVAELVREAFLASLQPDVVHVTSLFEGYADDAVISIGRFDRKTPVSVSFYDLIPLLNPDQYLKPDPQFEHHYRAKVAFLEKSALQFAISDFTAFEGRECLNLPGNSVINVSTAIESDFQVVSISAEKERALLDFFGIERPFLLYTGGADDRKNLPRLIEAFANLPFNLRSTHQLVFAGKLPRPLVDNLNRLAVSAGLSQHSLCFTGYVPDDDLICLYNLCALYVFPSWHEGFGLPALEAMACGAPVIGANTSSLPEVIGLDEALFDPFDVASMTAKISQVLEDESFRQRLRDHGAEQSTKFSWDATASKAIAAWESLDSVPAAHEDGQPLAGRRKKLAFVSPMPPERSGISDYSALLLPALSAYYDIDIIVSPDFDGEADETVPGRFRDPSWLRANRDRFDHVLYQMGNSSFHGHMVALLDEIPGTVVLHDFFLSGLMYWRESEAGVRHAANAAFYHSHGYMALRDRFRDKDKAVLNYPANLSVLQKARGMIVHSDFSRDLARRWYGDFRPGAWAVVPLVRRPADVLDKTEARRKLGIADDEFVVCSFGFISATKLNHRLLDAWLNSCLAEDLRSRLVFVGQNDQHEYGANLSRTISESGRQDQIDITGFASHDTFNQYLLAADVGVQLRENSRGETSASALDCMGHGLPLIVNANGSMVDLDPRAIWMLPDQFADAELTTALETLFGEPERRNDLGRRARDLVLENHNADLCARRYAGAIERFAHQTETGVQALVEAIAERDDPPVEDLLPLSECIAASLKAPRPWQRLFLDVTATSTNNLKTGIERVARALVLALLETSPDGFRIEPVYLHQVNGRWHYRYARQYTLGLLGCPPDALEDEVVEPDSGDVLLGLDLSGEALLQAEEAGLFADYRNRGVAVYFTVFDLLPVRMPEVFPAGASEHHAEWLRRISRFDGAICISKTVAEEFASWRSRAMSQTADQRPFRIGWFHLGADLENSAGASEIEKDTGSQLDHLSRCHTFLMVGTIEPRKGHLQVLEAFDQLWNSGVEVNLVIVGREGWVQLPASERLQIAKTTRAIKEHPELDKHLFWLEDAGDERLEQLYSASSCLIAASYGEGFGLPLIEAAQHHLPILARDIPVFREVAGSHACFFDGESADSLAEAIRDWLRLFGEQAHPTSDTMPWLTWRESARQVMEFLIKDQDFAPPVHQPGVKSGAGSEH